MTRPRFGLALLVASLVAVAAPSAQTLSFPYADSAEDTTAALSRWATSTAGARFYTSAPGERAHTGAHAWRVGRNGTMTLTQPVSLAGRTNPHLRLWARANYVGTNPADRTCRDVPSDAANNFYSETGRNCGSVKLEVSTDGGALWETVASTSPTVRDGDALEGYGNGGQYNEAELRTLIRGGVWRPVQWPLDAYAGTSVLIRLTVSLNYDYLEASVDDLVLDEAPRNLDPVVSAATNRGFTVSWPASTAPDFRRYRLVVTTEERACSPGFTSRLVTGEGGYSSTLCVGSASDPHSLPLKLWRSERLVYEIDDPGRTSVTLDTLSFSGRRYFTRLYVQDTQGFTNQGGATVQELTSLDFGGAVKAPFVERFDAGAAPAGWLLEPAWGVSDEAGAEPGHSAPGVLTDSPGGNYTPYAYQYARVKLDLSDVGRPTLRFRHRYSTQPNLNNGGIDNTVEDDMAFVDASRDGLKWTRLGSFNGAADWAEVAFDLSPYAGLAEAYVRFGFHDDHSQMALTDYPSGSFQMVTRTREGWLIDDVEVSDNAAVAALPFADDAEAGGRWVAPFFQRVLVGDARSGDHVWRVGGSAYHGDPYYASQHSAGYDLDPATNPGGGTPHAWSWFTLGGTLDLRGVQSPSLSFWARTRGYSTTVRSQYYVQASVDGGRTWKDVVGSGNYVGGPDWAQYTYPLDGFQAPHTLVRVGYGSPGGLYGAWQEFDDFAITGAPAGAEVSGTVEFRLGGNNGAPLGVPAGTVVGVRGVDAPLSTQRTFPLSDPDGDGTWTGRVPMTAPLGATVRYLFVQLKDGDEAASTDCKQWSSSTPPTPAADYLSFTYTGSATVVNTWPCGPVAATPGEGVSFFTVTGGGAPVPQRLSTGFHPQGTAGLDEPYGEVEMPPAPPSGTFTARFVSGDGVDLGQGSLVDLRAGAAPATGRAVHHLLLQRATGGGGFTVAYDLPDRVWARLEDAVTGALYAQTVWGKGQVQIPSAGDVGAVERFTLTLTYGETCAAAPLAPGWNLVSAPLNAASMAPGTLFPGATNPYAFAGRYVGVDTFVPGAGYWVKAADGATATLCGAPVAAYEIPVRAGWNLIGGFENAASVDGLVPSADGLVTSNVFGYGAGYATAASLLPGRGYWVRASADGTLQVAPGGQQGRRRAPGVAEPEGGVVVVVEDAAGRRAELRLLAHGVTDGAGVLPPPPPSGLFDARLLAAGEGRRAVAEGAADLALQGAVYPVVVRAEGLAAGDVLAVSDALGRPLGEAGVEGGLTLAAGDLFRVAAASADAVRPDALSLSAVAPNPTRGRATVQFALPDAGPVRLTVFDVLGRELARLADGPAEAGVRTVLLPDDVLSPGLYVVRLEAGGQTLTRNFTVIR